jgi:predicted transcriptional regulator
MTKTEVHIGGAFADSKRRVLDAVAAAETGAFEAQTHITFESWPALARVMTPKRFESCAASTPAQPPQSRLSHGISAATTNASTPTCKP